MDINKKKTKVIKSIKTNNRRSVNIRLKGIELEKLTSSATTAVRLNATIPQQT